MKYCSDLVRSALWVPIFCSLASGAVAAGRPYGDDFVRYGHARSDTAPALSGGIVPAEVAPARGGDAYMRQVEALESAFGPYADGLDEPLSDLGRHYLSRGETDKALEVFTRAMHVVRVNDGLYSERQLPLLRATLDTYRLGGDFEALDERYDYYYNMFGAGEPPYTEPRLRASLAYLRWQREALRLGVGKQSGRRLLTLLRHNDDLIEEVGRDRTLALHWQIDLALSQVKNYYLLQELVEEPQPEQLYTSRHMNPGAEFGRPTQHNPLMDDLMRRRGNVVGLGADTLEDVLLELPQGADPELRARLLLALADWHQWHGDFRDAERYYVRTVSTLSEAGRQDLLDQWLGEPVELPDNGVFFQPRFGESVPEENAVAVRYSVSASGRVRDAQLVQEAEVEQPADAQRILRRLRGTVFRPRWADGYAEPSAGLSRRYVWVD